MNTFTRTYMILGFSVGLSGIAYAQWRTGVVLPNAASNDRFHQILLDRYTHVINQQSLLAAASNPCDVRNTARVNDTDFVTAAHEHRTKALIGVLDVQIASLMACTVPDRIIPFVAEIRRYVLGHGYDGLAITWISGGERPAQLNDLLQRLRAELPAAILVVRISRADAYTLAPIQDLVDQVNLVLNPQPSAETDPERRLPNNHTLNAAIAEEVALRIASLGIPRFRVGLEVLLCSPYSPSRVCSDEPNEIDLENTHIIAEFAKAYSLGGISSSALDFGESRTRAQDAGAMSTAPVREIATTRQESLLAGLQVPRLSHSTADDNVAGQLTETFGYYVDSSLGDDSYPGTQQFPWKTIKRVNSAYLRPGDSVGFKRGSTWHETLNIAHSGSPGQPIVFGAYGSGPNPIIDGADLYRSDWRPAVTTPRVIGCASGNGGKNSQTVSYSPTAGNTLIAAGYNDFNTITAFTLSDGTPMTIDTVIRKSGTRLAVAHYSSTPAGTTSVTVQGGRGRFALVVCEVAGLSVDALDTVDTSGSVQTGPAWASPTIATTGDNDIAFAVVAQHATVPCTGTPITITAATVPPGALSCSPYNQLLAVGYDIVPQPLTVSASGTVGDTGHEVFATILAFRANRLSNVWRHSFTPSYVAYPWVFFDGVAGGSNGGQPEPSPERVIAPHQWHWDRAGNIFVFSATDPRLAFTNPGIEISARPGVQASNQSYIRFDSLDVRRTAESCFDLYQLTYGTVSRSHATFCGKNGIVFYNSGLPSDHFTVSNNVVAYTADTGIAAKDSNGGSISGNDVSHAGIMKDDEEAIGIVGRSGDNYVYDNYAHDNTDQIGPVGIRGIEIDTIEYPRINYIYRNVVARCNGSGIIVEHSSGQLVYGNVSILNEAHLGGNCCVAGIKDSAGYGNKYYNNTTFKNQFAEIEITNDSGFGPVLQNNLLLASPSTQGAIFTNGSTATAVRADYNLVYGGRTLYNWNDMRYDTVTAFYSATGQGEHDISADPRFVGPSNAVFDLGPGSPAIGTGAYIPGVTQTSPPNIGAK